MIHGPLPGSPRGRWGSLVGRECRAQRKGVRAAPGPGCLFSDPLWVSCHPAPTSTQLCLPHTTSPPQCRTVGQALLPFSQQDVFLPRATPRLLKGLNFSCFICRGNQSNHSFLFFIHLFFCLLSGSFIRSQIFTKHTCCFRPCAPETPDDAERLVGPLCTPRP